MFRESWLAVYGYRFGRYPGGRAIGAAMKVGSELLASSSYLTPLRVCARQIGPVLHDFVFCSPDPKDVSNIIWGCRERVLISPPERDRNLVAPFKRFVRDWLKQNIVVTGSPKSFEDWLENTRYTMVRKRQLREAWLKGEQRQKWHRCKSFIKREFYPLFKPPRTINSRVDNYKAFAGPWFHWIEKCVIGQSKYFVKGMTVQERIAHVRQQVHGQYVYVSDFSRFESQMTRETMEICEMALYRHFGMPEYLLLPLIGMNELRFQGVRAKVLATRMSGDMCTSLGNSFTNLMVNLFVANMLGAEITGVVEGDDGLFGTTIVPKESVYTSLGFKMSVKSVSNVGCAGFCSSWWDAEGVPLLDVRRVLGRVGWSFSCPPRAKPSFRQALLNAKIESMCELSNCTPILWKLSKYHKGKGLARADGYKIFGDQAWIETSGHIDFYEPTMIQRLFVAQNQGISITDQLMIEKMIDNDDWTFGKLLLRSKDNLDACILIGREI